MLAALLGWVLPGQSTPSLLHKRPKGRFGLHAIVYNRSGTKFFLALLKLPEYISSDKSNSKSMANILLYY